jgi:hypothetical protein
MHSLNHRGSGPAGFQRLLLVGFGLCAGFLLSWSPAIQAAPVDLPSLQPASDWSAQWIGVAGGAPSPRNQWLAYRQTFRLSAIPKSAVARIACDSKYWLWINGQLAVFEGQLKRGPTPTASYFDTVDLRPFLKPGDNSVAVLMWHFGRHGFSHNNSGRSGLVFELAADGQIFRSDKTWKARVHPAFGSTGKPHPNFRLPEANLYFDAGKELAGWQQPGYSDQDWPSAGELGVPPTAPWGALYPRPVPQWRHSGLQDYVNAQSLPSQSTGQVVIARLPYNAQVTPYFKVVAPAGLKISVQTDNYLGGGTESVRAEYLTRAGEQEFEILTWMNGHDVRYQIPAGVRILALKYRESGYDADFVGRFQCDDPAVNTLWQKAQRTLYITMRDTYMDCPDRERSQWWGDAVNELGESFYVFDYARGPLLTRKAMLELARWQKPSGSLFSPVPAGVPDPARDKTWNEGVWDKELPPQMLASVSWYGFWTYHFYSGDRETLVAVYPAVKRYLALWKFNADGLVEHRKGDWDWTDWGNNIDHTVSDSAWLYLALKGAVEMARVAGAPEDVPGYRQQMKSIEDNFNRVFWNGKAYRSAGHKGVTDDRVQALAVVSGLATPDFYPAIREVFKQSREASPYMEKYVLEALFQMGAGSQAISRMKARFAAQIDSPLTTLWEGWGIGSQGYGGGTYNHAWSGGALTVLCQYAAGIRPTAAGWQTFQIQPQPGTLQKIAITVPVPRGVITLDWRRQGGAMSADLSIPDGMQGEFLLPRMEGVTWHQTSVNGKTVPPDRPIPLRSGTYRITAE